MDVKNDVKNDVRMFFWSRSLSAVPARERDVDTPWLRETARHSSMRVSRRDNGTRKIGVRTPMCVAPTLRALRAQPTEALHEVGRHQSFLRFMSIRLTFPLPSRLPHHSGAAPRIAKGKIRPDVQG